jgi:hypothetical protein
MEGMDDLNLNLLDHSGWSFIFSRMLYNSLYLRINTVVNWDSPHQTFTTAQPKYLFLLETQKYEDQQLLNEFEEKNLN